MYKILVTGVGAIIGYGIIEGLKNSGYELEIIGIDIYEDAIGKEWCDEFVVGVKAYDKNFIPFLKRLLVEKEIDLVIPGIEQDIEVISNNINEFKELNTIFALNNLELIKVATDKWLTHIELVNHNVNAIRTFIEGEYDDVKQTLSSPFLLKPRRSYASKGIFLIENRADYIYWQDKLQDNFMVQEIVGDTNSEYTVGVFGLGKGQYSSLIMMQRTLGSDGATSKARVIENEKLEESIINLVGIFQPIGPTNFQFREHNGEFLLLEINPRISSSTSIRTKCGYNEAKMCIEYYLEKKAPTVPKVKKGYARRYIKDLMQYDSDNL